MKKVLFALTICLALSSFTTTNLNESVSNEQFPIEDLSCFEGAHSFFTYYYGGVNISNVGAFNRLVAYCEAQQQ